MSDLMAALIGCCAGGFAGTAIGAARTWSKSRRDLERDLGYRLTWFRWERKT